MTGSITAPVVGGQLVCHKWRAPVGRMSLSETRVTPRRLRQETTPWPLPPRLARTEWGADNGSGTLETHVQAPKHGTTPKGMARKTQRGSTLTGSQARPPPPPVGERNTRTPIRLWHSHETGRGSGPAGSEPGRGSGDRSG